MAGPPNGRNNWRERSRNSQANLSLERKRARRHAQRFILLGDRGHGRFRRFDAGSGIAGRDLSLHALEQNQYLPVLVISFGLLAHTLKVLRSIADSAGHWGGP